MNIQYEVFKVISEESKNDVQASDITIDDTFEQVGLDSLSVVTVIIWLEDILGIEVKEKELSKIKSIKDIVEICEKKYSELNI